MLGIAQPLTFCTQIHSATMYLRYKELIPLYATEWICIAAVGISVSAITWFVDLLVNRVRRDATTDRTSRAVFAMIVGAAVVIGVQAWIGSFRRGSLSLNEWHILIVAASLVAGVGALYNRFLGLLRRLHEIAVPISLIGGLSVLSLTWIHQPAISASNHRGEVLANGGGHPNIVLISIDALSARHLIPYGYNRATSPNIAALAAESIVFDEFYAVSNFTTTGVSTILTGVMPWTHRAVQLLGRPTESSISMSLPLRLHEAGYETAYFASNPWAGGSREGMGNQFDHHYSGIEWETAPCLDRLADRFPYLCAAAANPFVSIVYKGLVSVAGTAGFINIFEYADPAGITAAATAYLAQPHSSPVFLWIHYLPPHDPYAAPAPWIGRFDSSPAARTNATSHPQYLFGAATEPIGRVELLEARYDESILHVDFYVGNLISAVRKRLGPNTAILLTADHGESLSHGYGGHGGVMMYEDLIHIPLILKQPGQDAPTGHRSRLADQSDLAPTIAALADIVPAASWEGASLLGAGQGDGKGEIFSMNFEQNRSRDRLSTGSVAVRSAEWKLVKYLGAPQYPGMPTLNTQLFDVVLDPDERIDVASQHPEVVAELSSKIDQQLDRHGGPLQE